MRLRGMTRYLQSNSLLVAGGASDGRVPAPRPGPCSFGEEIPPQVCYPKVRYLGSVDHSAVHRAAGSLDGAVGWLASPKRELGPPPMFHCASAGREALSPGRLARLAYRKLVRALQETSLRRPEQAPQSPRTPSRPVAPTPPQQSQIVFQRAASQQV